MTTRTTRLMPSTLALTERALVRFFRTPQEVVVGTVTMAMFLTIFLFVFGGEIAIPGFGYVDFLVPGYLAAGAMFAGMGTAAAVADDMERGFVDRVRSLPIPRLSFLTGRAAADTIVLVWSLGIAAVIGVALGFRPHAPVGDVVAAAGLLMLYGFAFIWLFLLLGMIAGSAKGAQGLSFLVFPLTFASSAYVRVDALPGWMQAFAEHQPVTVMVDSVRGLVLGPDAAALLTSPLGASIARSVAWAVAIIVVSAIAASVRHARG